MSGGQGSTPFQAAAAGETNGGYLVHRSRRGGAAGSMRCCSGTKLAQRIMRSRAFPPCGEPARTGGQETIDMAQRTAEQESLGAGADVLIDQKRRT